MTKEKRQELVNDAFDWMMRRADETREMVQFREDCMKAIIGAAFFLDRDPIALAELLTDGRLAEYIHAAEGTIPLSLDDPAPAREPIEDLLRVAAEWAEAERERFERKVNRMLKQFEMAEQDLRKRVARARRWKTEWRNVGAFDARYRIWRRERGFSSDE